MTALDYILDGLESELALERELGVRVVECDRSLVTDVRDAPRAPVTAAVKATPKEGATLPSRGQNGDFHAFVFLHHREMGAQETEMMTKIVAALGTTLVAAPIVFEPPIPKAKVYVVLGQRALTRFFPGRKTAFDSWFESEKGKPILFTRAPVDILRFKEVTPAVKKMKLDMWQSLKGVMQRIG